MIAPVWLFMSGWTAKAASTYHLILWDPSSENLRTSSLVLYRKFIILDSLAQSWSVEQVVLVARKLTTGWTSGLSSRGNLTSATSRSLQKPKIVWSFHFLICLCVVKCVQCHHWCQLNLKSIGHSERVQQQLDPILVWAEKAKVSTWIRAGRKKKRESTNSCPSLLAIAYTWSSVDWGRTMCR